MTNSEFEKFYPLLAAFVVDFLCNVFLLNDSFHIYPKLFFVATSIISAAIAIALITAMTSLDENTTNSCLKMMRKANKFNTLIEYFDASKRLSIELSVLSLAIVFLPFTGNFGSYSIWEKVVIAIWIFTLIYLSLTLFRLGKIMLSIAKYSKNNSR